MDEVLTTWAARLPSNTAIYSALEYGSEFAPPLYPVTLHLLARVVGSSYLVPRLPSIVAVLVTGISSFLLLQRRFGVTQAILGFVFVAEGMQT